MNLKKVEDFIITDVEDLLETCKEAFFMYADSLELIQIPADGCAYEFNVERPHTFLNCNRHENRWHLVLNGLV